MSAGQINANILVYGVYLTPNELKFLIMETHLSEDKANKVYDLLVSIGGANEEDRSSFIYHHCESKYGCTEWRFCGKLGFGGKYRSTWNGVTYYPEDETPERIEIKNQLNNELKKI